MPDSNLNSNDHILGASAEIRFFDGKMALKAIHVNGGIKAQTQGTWSETQGQGGDVTATVFVTDFFENLFVTELEYDRSDFDADTEDDTDEVGDKAYRVKFSGQKGLYSYALYYAYTGPEYNVVGNQSIIQDWAGYDLTSGIMGDNHSLSARANYFWDNVEDDTFYARIYSTTWGLDYYYTGSQRFPLSLSYEFNMRESTDEPIGVDETSTETNTVIGGINYIEGPWSVGMRANFSVQDDETADDADMKLYTFELVPTYILSDLSIIPSWTFNLSKDLSSDVETKTHTFTLDVSYEIFAEKLSCNFGGTYDRMVADDDSIDSKNSTLYLRLSYHYGSLGYFKDTTLALEYNTTRQEDFVYDYEQRESTVTLVPILSYPLYVLGRTS